MLLRKLGIDPAKARVDKDTKALAGELVVQEFIRKSEQYKGWEEIFIVKKAKDRDVSAKGFDPPILGNPQTGEILLTETKPTKGNSPFQYKKLEKGADYPQLSYQRMFGTDDPAKVILDLDWHIQARTTLGNSIGIPNERKGIISPEQAFKILEAFQKRKILTEIFEVRMSHTGKTLSQKTVRQFRQYPHLYKRSSISLNWT